MKKLDTLKKTLETLENEKLVEMLNSIIANENVDVDTLTATEKLSVLMYHELSKALNSKKHTLLLDCNYADSKNVQNSIYAVDYYRLAVANSMIQIYVKKNSFAICTSASKANREHFKTLENELHFVTKYDTKTQRAKTTQRNNISYDELVDVIKNVIAVLESTATAKATESTAQ